MFSYRVIAFRSALVAGLSLFSGLASALSLGVGPLGGLNLGNYSFDNTGTSSINTEIRSGLALGARAELGVTKPYSLLLEPMFLQRGAVVKATIGAMKAHAYVFAGPN